MRKLWLVLVIGALMTGATSAEASAGRLDPSFGNNGVVPIDLPLPAPWQTQYLNDMSASYDGSSYVLVDHSQCDTSGCLVAHALLRYTADGVLDPSFGGPGGFYELSEEPYNNAFLAVDSQGRPLLAEDFEGKIVIRRLTSAGTLDPTFGVGGVVTLDCACSGSRIVPGPAGTLTIVTRGEEREGRSFREVTLIRLLADGSVDSGFGNEGRTTLMLPGAEPLVDVVSSRKGAFYVAALGCCTWLGSYFVRVSARGQLDTRFDAAAHRSLLSLRKPKFNVKTMAVVARPRGKIDLLGYATGGKGFSLRLNPNGRIHRRYGRNGLQLLPHPVNSAALGSDGATMALTDGSTGVPGVMRILADGRPDPRFDWSPIPGGRGDRGLSVVPQAGRKVLVLDRGVHECRGSCVIDPKLIRFLEGPRPRRR
jgi:uncharacterized delta-60 repeat protein